MTFSGLDSLYYPVGTCFQLCAALVAVSYSDQYDFPDVCRSGGRGLERSFCMYAIVYGEWRCSIDFHSAIPLY